MPRCAVLLVACLLIVACSSDPVDRNEAAANEQASSVAPIKLSLTRLDCGTPTIKNFDKFFSDKPGLYESAPRDITDSCYLIKRGDQLLLWDTGLDSALKGRSFDTGDMVLRLNKTLTEQLAQIGVKPEDIDIVGISHEHADHTGQAAQFAQAELIIGKGDFDDTKGKDDPFGPWRKDAAKVRSISADTDVFGDGTVVAVHLPGHTPDHLALLVKLASGPVLLSGDLYHSRDAREKRGVPPFNTSREHTLRSMEKFEKVAKDNGAKVVIQHEPRDIGLLPAFPQAAQ